jgi:uncharacterized protein (DUF849 family)
MAAARKVIITCAVTGSIHTPTMTPYLPITPDEVAQASIGAAEAGAAIIHLHARDPKDGKPTPSPEVFMQFLPRIKQNTDAVLIITTGGGGDPAGARGRRPQGQAGDGDLQHGPMNFGLIPCSTATRTGSTSGSRSTSRPRATSSSATPSRTSNS